MTPKELDAVFDHYESNLKQLQSALAEAGGALMESHLDMPLRQFLRLLACNHIELGAEYMKQEAA
jgi:hypothetical protein